MGLFDRDRTLALDIGASKLVLAEFVGARRGSPQLLRYGIEELGVEPDSDADASPFVVAAIREIMRREGIRPGPVLIAISGQAVFPRYVQLPPVTRDKILQIVRYEAEQNVPFPIEEVVWDYQLIEGGDGEELNVMLVAVKTDRVTSLTDCVLAAGLEPEIVDVAPMALYNAVRFSYPDLPGCTMVLDVGARSSNVIFVEERRIFSRSIPVAGNTITHEIAKSFDLPFRDAEHLKREHGFVALGGVYAGAEDDDTDRISKLSRTVVTRLHAEVNRSINFYRSQQGGSPPVLVLLTGGSSMLPHLDTFFREKLGVQVDYLNPFEQIPVSDGIDAEQVGRDAFLMGEVAGLALREALVCPVEINLMPRHILARKARRRRQPFFAAAAVFLVLVLLCWWAYFQRVTESLDMQIKATKDRTWTLDRIWQRLEDVKKQKAAAAKKLDRLTAVANLRTRWVDIFDAVHAAALDGMWLAGVRPVTEGGKVTGLEIEGRGFKDKVPDGTYVERFRDRLIASPLFDKETKIVRLPRPGEHSLSFTLRVVLAEPVEAGA